MRVLFHFWEKQNKNNKTEMYQVISSYNENEHPYFYMEYAEFRKVTIQEKRGGFHRQAVSPGGQTKLKTRLKTRLKTLMQLKPSFRMVRFALKLKKHQRWWKILMLRAIYNDENNREH